MSKELTDDFLNKKLQAGSFYFVETGNGHPEPMVIDIDGDFNDYEGNYYKPEFSKGKLEVLVPCDYNHIIKLTEKGKKYDRIKVNGNYPDKISRLKSRIKHLLEMQDNQDKELESARWYQTIQNEDIAKLRNLLEECRIWMSWAYAELYEYDSEHESKDTEDLLTRVNIACS